MLVQLARHTGDLRFRECVNTEGFDEFVHAACRDAGEVGVSDDGDHRGFGAFAAFEEPLGEIRALPQLRDRDVYGSDTGIEFTGAVTVAGIHSVSRGLAVFGAADLVCFGGEERVDHGL